MALFQFDRRILANPQETPLRWSLWWKTAIQRSQGLYIELALSHLLSGSWIIDDITASKALKFFQETPGWRDAGDGYGTPLSFKRLSPMEEHKALTKAAPELRAKLVEVCTCPPNASRQVRKIAEKAFRQLVEQKIKEASK